jgi:hypothetical protein
MPGMELRIERRDTEDGEDVIAALEDVRPNRPVTGVVSEALAVIGIIKAEALARVAVGWARDVALELQARSTPPVLRTKPELAPGEIRVRSKAGDERWVSQATGDEPEPAPSLALLIKLLERIEKELDR